MKRPLFVLVLLLLPVPAILAQQPLADLNAARLALNWWHGLILMGWAIANLVIGGYLTWVKRGQVEAFWHMNAAFNLVNFAIAAIMLYQTDTAAPGALGLLETLRASFSAHGLMMLNIGLDVCYALTGLWMQEYGRRHLRRGPLLRGFGFALILQGLFLFSLDVTFTSLYYRYHWGAIGLAG